MAGSGANIHAAKTHLLSTRIIVRGGVLRHKATSINTECGKRENNRTENFNGFNREVKSTNGRENCCSNCLKKYDAHIEEIKYQRNKLAS
jgi:hypothetical protein